MDTPQHRAVTGLLPELRRRAATAVREISVAVVAVLLVGAAGALAAERHRHVAARLAPRSHKDR